MNFPKGPVPLERGSEPMALTQDPGFGIDSVDYFGYNQGRQCGSYLTGL